MVLSLTYGFIPTPALPQSECEHALPPSYNVQGRVPLYRHVLLEPQLFHACRSDSSSAVLCAVVAGLPQEDAYTIRVPRCRVYRIVSYDFLRI